MLKLFIALFTLLLVGCDATTVTDVKGDRDVTQISSGRLMDRTGNSRTFYILRDADTGVDYLAVIDAGIIELKPKPGPQPQQTKVEQ